MATAQEYGRAGQLEIIVQDDCSPFKVADIIGPPASVVVNKHNLGFAGNCNAGASRAHGDILLFLNQDTKARSEWFAPLVNIFSGKLNVGIVGPKLIFSGETIPGQTIDKWSIQSVGGLYGGNKGPYHRFIGFADDDWRVNMQEKVSWTTGAALAIRRELFFKVGGFDASYQQGYFEDVDLCEKVKAAGYEIWYEPLSCFEHSVGSTGGVAPEIFKANSMLFHSRWDAAIVPDSPVSHVNY